MLTVDPKDFVWQSLFPLIARSAPRLFQPRITSSSLAKLLSSSEQAAGLDYFEVTQVSARSHLHERRRGKRFRSELMWTEESTEDVLAALRERGQWLHSVAFRYRILGSAGRLRCSARFSRQCSFAMQGEFSWSYHNPLQSMIKDAAAAVRFYSNRGRTGTPRQEPRPVAIHYPDAVFHDKTKLRHLARVLHLMTRSSVSVLHANPYFRASVVDFTDGSCYDIWVLSENSIIITPQLRATSASMGRVCDHILSWFGEGTLRDHYGIAESQHNG